MMLLNSIDVHSARSHLLATSTSLAVRYLVSIRDVRTICNLLSSHQASSYRVINQNWDTWFSANIRATNFKQRLNCSSHQTYLANVQQDGYGLISQRVSGLCGCPNSIKIGTVQLKLGHLRLVPSVLDGGVPILIELSQF